MRAPVPAPPASEPGLSAAILANPRVGGVSPHLRAHVHHLVATYPAETVRVLREWVAEGGAAHPRH